MSREKKIAEEVLELVGKKENISNVYHCMTRLRFQLKDYDKIDQEKVKAIQGVLGCQIQENELQVIIGPAVDSVYREVIEITGLDSTDQIIGNEEKINNKKITVKSVANSIIGAFSGCMSPLVPLFVALGMANIVSALIGPSFLNLVKQESHLYTNFYYIGQTIIYFLPVLVAVTASKKFGSNTFVSVTLACLMVYPDMIASLEGGYTIFGISTPNITYSGQIIPIMLVVWVQSYIEKLLKKVIPDVVKVLLVSFLTVIIMLPISFIVLGPIGNYAGVALTNGVIALRELAGPIETMLVTALIPFLTAFGIGRPIFFACMTILMSTGQEYAYMPIAMVLNNWIIMGLSLGYMVRSKNPNQKQLGATCFASNFLGGVSEPALFGILLPNKRLFLPVIIGGALGGLYLGIMNVGYFQMGASNFLSVMGFVGGEGTSNFIHGCIASGICLVATFMSTYLLFRDKKESV